MQLWKASSLGQFMEILSKIVRQNIRTYKEEYLSFRSEKYRKSRRGRDLLGVGRRPTPPEHNCLSLHKSIQGFM
jgi:hypothetical protein